MSERGEYLASERGEYLASERKERERRGESEMRSSSNDLRDAKKKKKPEKIKKNQKNQHTLVNGRSSSVMRNRRDEV